jgi:hypothetical protein
MEAAMTTAETRSRDALPKNLAKEVQYQIAGLSRTDLSAYTYEHIKSSYKDAKSDLSIFDPEGKLILLGRGFGDRTFFWWAAIQDVRLATS